jgi:hypothetical protein
MSARLTRNLFLVALLVIGGATAASAQTYWFETYQTAVDKIEDPQQHEIEDALSLLETLVAEHPLPQSKVRIPGDRYIDYLPYFQQARIQAALGQYNEAGRSLDISEAFGAVKTNRRAMTSLREMRGALNRRTAVQP